MAALLVAMGVIAVVLSTTLPVFSTMARREREAELVFRGQQYARAVSLFQRKYANALPPSLDVLLNERFLRKQYKDPITGEDFQLVGPGSPELAEAVNSAPGQQQPGRGGPQVVQQQQQQQQQRQQTSGRGVQSNPITAGMAPGGILGVVSKSKDTLIAALQQSRQVQRVGIHRDADERGSRGRGSGRYAGSWWSWWRRARCRAGRASRGTAA